MLAVSLGKQIKSLDQPREDSFVEIMEDEETRGGDKKKVIADPFVFEAILVHMPFNFTDDAAKVIISQLSLLWRGDPLFAKEVSQSRRLLQLLFDLDERYDEPSLTNMHRSMLAHLLDSKSQNLWELIRPQLPRELVFITDVIGHFIQHLPEMAEKLVPVFILQLCNKFEDSVLQDPGRVNSPEFLQALARLLLVLDKTDLLYVAVPAFPAFDLRLLDSEAEEKAAHVGEERDAREGGIVRIVLKLILQCITKGSPSAATDACTLLKFYLLRDKEKRRCVKLLAVLPHSSTSAKKLKKKKKKDQVYYNLLDVALKKNVAKLKFHQSRVEYFAKRVIKGKTSFLDSLNIGSKKLTKHCPKDESIFDQGSLLLLYILEQVFQTLHFELLGISSYSELPQTLEGLHQRFEAVNSEVSPSAKFQELVSLLWEIASQYGAKEIGLVQLLTTDFEALMHKLRSKMRIYCGKDHGPVAAHGTGTEAVGSYDSSQETSELSEDAKSRPSSSKPDQGQGDLSFVSQETDFGQFILLWSMLVEALMNSMADKKQVVSSYKIMESLLLKASNIQVVQRFGHVCIAHALSRFDFLVSQSLSRAQTLPFPVLKTEDQQIYKELETRVRDKFCYVGIHTEKIGNLFAEIC